MENISINEFQLVTSADGAYILLSIGGGQGGRIAVGTFTEQYKPSIRDGVWYIGNQTTGVTAQGEDGKSVRLRQGTNGIEWAYVDEENWQMVVPYSELKLEFDDLTDEQKAQLKMTLDDLSPEDIALLQQPARDMIKVLESTNTQMQAAKDDAQDTADHPTYIGIDHYVYKWNKTTKTYDKTDIYVKGDTGEQGIQGERGVQGEQGDKGDKGDSGLPPTLEIGYVTTVDAGTNASAAIRQEGTTEDGSPIYVIDLFLPRGAKGENGAGSGNVLVDASHLVKGKKYAFTPNQDGSAEGTFEEVVVPEIDTSSLATKEELKGKVDKVDGKQLSTEDFTTLLKQKLESLSNYDDTAITSALEDLQSQFDTLLQGDASAAIESFNEIIAFLEGVEDSESLDGIIGSIEQQIAAKQDKILAINHGTSDTSFALTPNVYHKWGEVASLELTLETPSDASTYNEYMFEFVSGDTATTLSLPSTVVFESELNIEANKTYQVSIVNNIGVIIGV